MPWLLYLLFFVLQSPLLVPAQPGGGAGAKQCTETFDYSNQTDIVTSFSRTLSIDFEGKPGADLLESETLLPEALVSTYDTLAGALCDSCRRTLTVDSWQVYRPEKMSDQDGDCQFQTDCKGVARGKTTVLVDLTVDVWGTSSSLSSCDTLFDTYDRIVSKRNSTTFQRDCPGGFLDVNFTDPTVTGNATFCCRCRTVDGGISVADFAVQLTRALGVKNIAKVNELQNDDSRCTADGTVIDDSATENVDVTLFAYFASNDIVLDDANATQFFEDFVTDFNKLNAANCFPLRIARVEVGENLGLGGIGGGVADTDTSGAPVRRLSSSYYTYTSVYFTTSCYGNLCATEDINCVYYGDCRRRRQRDRELDGVPQQEEQDASTRRTSTTTLSEELFNRFSTQVDSPPPKPPRKDVDRPPLRDQCTCAVTYDGYRATGTRPSKRDHEREVARTISSRNYGEPRDDGTTDAGPEDFGFDLYLDPDSCAVGTISCNGDPDLFCEAYGQECDIAGVLRRRMLRFLQTPDEEDDDIWVFITETEAPSYMPSVAPTDAPIELPVPSITEPLSGAVFTADDTIPLQVNAFDAQGNLLDGQAVEWSDSVVGTVAFGSNTVLDASVLGMGTHVLSVTAADSATGTVSAAATIQIEIVAAPTTSPPTPRPTTPPIVAPIGAPSNYYDPTNFPPRNRPATRPRPRPRPTPMAMKMNVLVMRPRRRYRPRRWRGMR